MKKSDFKYPHLFAPIQLGNVLFRNRIFASPTGYQNLNGDGYLNDGAAAYYGRKAMEALPALPPSRELLTGSLEEAGLHILRLIRPI
ncbi:MAG: hypothetical protein ACLRMZ_02455 [Blautia marasmi]